MNKTQTYKRVDGKIRQMNVNAFALLDDFYFNGKTHSNGGYSLVTISSAELREVIDEVKGQAADRQQETIKRGRKPNV